VKYLWDTNTCIAHLRGRFPALTKRLAREGPDIALCSVVVSEILYGVLRSRDPAAESARSERFLQRLVSLPFDAAAAVHAARIRAHLQQAGTPIGPYDVQIAAIALANGLTVVTHNTGEFRRVPGLAVEDWQVS
jgi:tRNA(fMet)-specific endonuclease VapC